MESSPTPTKPIYRCLFVCNSEFTGKESKTYKEGPDELWGELEGCKIDFNNMIKWAIEDTLLPMPQ